MINSLIIVFMLYLVLVYLIPYIINRVFKINSLAFFFGLTF